jgi:CHASE2 domain-containing sensor protein
MMTPYYEYEPLQTACFLCDRITPHRPEASNPMTNNSLLKRPGLILPIFSVAFGLTLLLFDPLPLQSLRNNLFEQYQRWHPRDYAKVMVRIDDESLRRRQLAEGAHGDVLVIGEK